MKRAGIILVIIAIIGTGSCTPLSHKSELKTDLDTLMYFYGMSRTDGIMSYLTMQVGVDTAYMDAFYQGFKEGAKHFSPKDIAFYEGVRLAHLINNQWVDNLNQEIFMGDSGQSVNRKSLLAGFYNGVKYKDQLDIMHAQSFSHVKLETIKNNYKKLKYADHIAASEQFLAENKNRAGVITTESGLQYKIIKDASGDVPGERAKIKVHYRGTLVDGTEFDNSYNNKEPTTFYATQVIKGWAEALKMMPVGSKWELYVPHDLAYDAAGSLPKIPPYSTLIFEIELVEIESY